MKEAKVVRDEGLYAGRLFDYYIGTSKKGYPQVVIIWEMIGRYESLTSAVDDYVKAPMFSRYTYWPVTLERVIEEMGEVIKGTAARVYEDMKYLGFEGKSLLELKRENWQPDHSRVYQMECRHDSWEGKPQERWSLFRPIDHSDPKRLEAFEQLHRLFEESQRRRPRRRVVSQGPSQEPETNGAVV